MGSEQGIWPGCESVGGIDGADGSGARPAEESGAAKPRYEVINREQLCWRRVDVERLIGEEHAARAVWEFVGQLDLSGYREEVRAVEGKAGRPGWEPRLLISLWIYAYSEGVNSGRAIEALELCVESWGVWSAEGLIPVQRVMQDGTKIRANAAADSFRRKERVEQALKQAQEQVAAAGGVSGEEKRART